MVLSLHTIKSGKGTAKKRKRVGRGNSSGKGTYSGRGLKGQGARAGVTNLKRLGMKQVLLRTPKKRGFKSQKPKDQIINILTLNKHFKDKDIINSKTLLEKKLIDSRKKGIKILSQGELKLKNLIFSGVKLSEAALRQVEKMSSKSEITDKKNTEDKKAVKTKE